MIMQNSDLILGQVNMSFKVDNRVARVVFKYQYSKSDDVVKYLDIEYSDPKLESLIENDASMMEKVDLYVRSLIDRQNHARLKKAG